MNNRNNIIKVKLNGELKDIKKILPHILEQTTSITLNDKDLYTYVRENHDTEIIKLLVKKGIFSEKQCSQLLEEFAGNIEMLKFLIENGAKTNSSFAISTLNRLLIFDKKTINAKFLIDAGTKFYNHRAKIYESEDFYNGSFYFSKRSEWLLEVVKEIILRGNVESLRFLLDNKFIKMTEISKMLENAFLLAEGIINSDRVEIIEFCIEFGVNFQNSKKDYLSMAIEKNAQKIQKVLLKEKIGISKPSAFKTALKYENIDVIKIAIENGIDVNLEEGEPLKIACEDCSVEIVKMLINTGAKIEGEYIQKAIMKAVQHRRIEIVKMFIKEYNVDVTFKKNLLVAAAADNGDIEMIKILIEAGANIKDCDDRAVRYAANSLKRRTVEFLIEQGADITAKDNYALKWALLLHNDQQAKSLIELGASKEFSSSRIEDYVYTGEKQWFIMGYSEVPGKKYEDFEPPIRSMYPYWCKY